MGYEGTIHNIKYWDTRTGTTKVATHDSKDEVQYGDDIHNRSPASKHLMEVFTGSNDHTTNVKPGKKEINAKEVSTNAFYTLFKEILKIAMKTLVQVLKENIASAAITA